MARMKRGPIYQLLYSIAVAVSAITTLLTPWLIRLPPSRGGLRRSQAAAVAADVRRALRLVAGEACRLSSVDESTDPHSTARPLADRRRRGRGGDRHRGVDGTWTRSAAGASEQFESFAESGPTAFVVAGAAIVSAPFWIGMVRSVARCLGFELASRVFPASSLEKFDMAAAPRQLLVVTLQLAIVLLVGFPLVAITQPFLPTLRGAAVLVFLLTLLAFAFWRNARICRVTRRPPRHGPGDRPANAQGRAMEADRSRRRAKLEEVNRIITGLGSPVSIELQPGSSACRPDARRE